MLVELLLGVWLAFLFFTLREVWRLVGDELELVEKFAILVAKTQNAHLRCNTSKKTAQTIEIVCAA